MENSREKNYILGSQAIIDDLKKENKDLKKENEKLKQAIINIDLLKKGIVKEIKNVTL